MHSQFKLDNLLVRSALAFVNIRCYSLALQFVSIRWHQLASFSTNLHPCTSIRCWRSCTVLASTLHRPCQLKSGTMILLKSFQFRQVFSNLFLVCPFPRIHPNSLSSCRLIRNFWSDSSPKNNLFTDNAMNGTESTDCSWRQRFDQRSLPTCLKPVSNWNCFLSGSALLGRWVQHRRIYHTQLACQFQQEAG